jgi:hypothetical protein
MGSRPPPAFDLNDHLEIVCFTQSDALAHRVGEAIAGGIVVLPFKMRFPGQLRRSISGAKNGCAGMDGVVAISSALQIDRNWIVRGPLPC